MKIKIISVGHKTPSWISRGEQEFLKRFNQKYSISLEEIKPAYREGESSENAKARSIEKDRILSRRTKSSHMIALDEQGQNYTSQQLAHMISGYTDSSQNLDFIIGGTDGLDAEIKECAAIVLSLSYLTFPHSLARLLLIEQLYRAQCIISNHPYHRD